MKTISIHAPPRGATTQRSFLTNWTTFQFTPLREGRPDTKEFLDELDDISIHAPPRGATRRTKRREKWSNYFNSRPSARGDLRCRRFCGFSLFQFTPLREGRLNHGKNAIFMRKFQFTPLREGRHVHVDEEGFATVFQFTPLREGRRRRTRFVPIALRFQFTPLREGRQARYIKGFRAWRFQFTPLREGRLPPSFIVLFAQISIHAPPRGATLS